MDIGSAVAWQRFIPAYAGNTCASLKFQGLIPVHPRVCGEHRLIAHMERCHGGSSPRMRGTLRNGERMRHGRRFIPAYAGNTLAAGATACETAVHPRVCGEHIVLFV